MKKKLLKIVTLATLMALILSSLSFAGSWSTVPFNSGSVKLSQFTTPVIKSVSGMPDVSFWVSAEPSVREVKVELLRKYYNGPKGVYEYEVLQSNTRTFSYNQTGFLSLNYTKSYLQEDDIKFRVTVIDGSDCQFDGKINYYKL